MRDREVNMTRTEMLRGWRERQVSMEVNMASTQVLRHGVEGRWMAAWGPSRVKRWQGGRGGYRHEGRYGSALRPRLLPFAIHCLCLPGSCKQTAPRSHLSQDRKVRSLAKKVFGSTRVRTTGRGGVRLAGMGLRWESKSRVCSMQGIGV